VTRDIVRVHAGHTHFDIDFDSCFENGLINAEDGYSSQDMIASVRKAIAANIALIDANGGGLVLIVGPVVAIAVLTKVGED
jgi:hypothetical protein